MATRYAKQRCEGGQLGEAPGGGVQGGAAPFAILFARLSHRSTTETEKRLTHLKPKKSEWTNTQSIE